MWRDSEWTQSTVSAQTQFAWRSAEAKVVLRLVLRQVGEGEMDTRNRNALIVRSAHVYCGEVEEEP